MPPGALTPDLIALRIAQELVPGTIVNIGVGIGFHLANVLTPDSGILLHAENGLIGFANWRDAGDDADAQVFGQPIGLVPGAASVDHVTSFGLIRTGRIHTTILGALEVDQWGHVASWYSAEMAAGGVGGAMELLKYCKRVIVAMRHTERGGRSRLRKQCETPLTGKRPADLIVTDLAVFRPTARGALELLETAPGVSVDTVIEMTEATVECSPTVIEMHL